MDSLKGTLISIAIFALLIVPVLVDIVSMGIATSQLNKVGAEMIQVIGSSSEYDGRTEDAIGLASSQYGIDVNIVSGTGYSLGDTVDLELTKEFTRMLPTPGDESEGADDEFHQVSLSTGERVMVTKRSGD